MSKPRGATSVPAPPPRPPGGPPRRPRRLAPDPTTDPTTDPVPRPLLLAVVLAAGGCGAPADVSTAESVPLRLDHPRPERLLGAVLGGYVGPRGGDPYRAGLVSGSGDGLALHPQRLAPEVRARLVDADGDGAVDWAELSAMLEATYYRARALPTSLDVLRRSAPYDEGGPEWFTVEVDGPMTAARRRVHVPTDALREAMVGLRRNGGLEYPPGTVIVGEHVAGGETAETTVQTRRSDGFWDYAVYDADGRLAPATTTEPRPLRAPTACVGCHLGDDLFEPERSWPDAPPDSARGRAVHVPDAWRSRPATVLLDEHAARDGGVLGLWATLYAGRLLAAREAGALGPADQALLDALGL